MDERPVEWHSNLVDTATRRLLAMPRIVIERDLDPDEEPMVIASAHRAWLLPGLLTVTSKRLIYAHPATPWRPRIETLETPLWRVEKVEIFWWCRFASFAVETDQARLTFRGLLDDEAVRTVHRAIAENSPCTLAPRASLRLAGAPRRVVKWAHGRGLL